MTEREIIIYYIGFYNAKYGMEQFKEKLAKQANITNEALINEVMTTVNKRFKCLWLFYPMALRW